MTFRIQKRKYYLFNGMVFLLHREGLTFLFKTNQKTIDGIRSEIFMRA